ncbi:UNVERIFIED_CONTAM: hypothetical protein RMT77_013088 [Armadillidium vulgare]
MDDLEKLSKNNETYSAQKRKHLVSSLGQERGVKSRGVCLPAAIADGLARHHAHEQLIYKQKLRKLKKFIRNIVLENAALCDSVAGVQEELALAIEERQYLLRKIMQIQLSTDQPLHQDLKMLPDFDEGEKSSQSRLTDDRLTSLTVSPFKASFLKRKSLANNEGDKSNCSSNNNNGSNPRSKSRWKKGAKVKRKCPPIPLDSSGRPIFPLHLGRLTIHSLGDIVGDKEGYHTESMIYPVGFCSSRMYASLKNPQNQSLYTCTIKEGSNKPRFDIICDEDEVAFYGNSPSDCHSQILQKINMILGIDLLPTSLGSTEAEERGLRFFGLSHPSVHNMIQACPGARKCGKYKWIQFEVCRSEAEAEGVLEPDREASICHETLLRNIRFASSHMGGGS